MEGKIPVTILGPFNDFSQAKAEFTLEKNSQQHVPASKSKSRHTHYY